MAQLAETGGEHLNEDELEQKQKVDRSKKINKSIAKQMHTKGKTYKEIAEHFGCSVDAVSKMFQAERKKEKEALENKKPRGRPPGSKNKRTLAEEAMLTNWKAQPTSPAMREDKADLNRAAGWFVTQCWMLGQSVDKENIESLYNALFKYVELCTQAGMPMLVKTCNLALGLNSSTITRWRNGTLRSNDPRFKEFAEMVESVIGAGIEAAAAAGSIDRVLTIWWQKAHFNMIEGNGQSTDTVDPLGQRMTPSEIVKKYDMLPD